MSDNKDKVGGYWQYCSFDEPNWKACSEKEYEMYENLPMYETRINPVVIKYCEDKL